MKTVAIVLAAGSGKRMGTAVKKQYLNVGGHPVLFYSLQTFQKSKYIDEIIIVTSPEDISTVKDEYMTGQFSKISNVVAGGKERYNSVYCGLKAISECDYVFIHDGARPFVDEEMLERCFECVKKEKACVAGVLSKDTVKLADENGYGATTPDRSRVWIIQTPQCFEYKLIYEAYSKLDDAEQRDMLSCINITDDAMVCEYFLGIKVKLIEGSYNNIKITTPVDLPMAEAILESI